MGLWERRDSWAGRIGLAAGLAVTTAWSVVLLGRTPNWFPALRPFVAVVGALGVVAILALPLLRPVPKLAVGLVAGLGLSAAGRTPLLHGGHRGHPPRRSPALGDTDRHQPGRARRRLSRWRVPQWRWTRCRRLPRRWIPGARLRRRHWRWLPGTRLRRRHWRWLPGRRGRARWRSGRRWCGWWRGWWRRRRVPERQPFEPGPHQAAAGERRPFHLARGDGELQQRRRVPVGQW